ncbi:unnamed protein product [Lymnaea stagnalis]|uniref:IGFBP N-terminal domain-containing protein n=1 Tax=Lymnaea stagnalis TaxID=6523 RepID=A0AAV2I4Q7_LYMST
MINATMRRHTPSGLFIVVMLLKLNSFSVAISCTGDPCNIIKCPDVSQENCKGKIISRGALCGCCDLCATVLNAGDVCSGLSLLGFQGPEVCPDGYECEFTSQKCELKPKETEE